MKIIEKLEKKLIEKGYDDIKLIDIDEDRSYKSNRKIKIYIFSVTQNGCCKTIELNKIDKNQYHLWGRNGDFIFFLDDIKI